MGPHLTIIATFAIAAMLLAGAGYFYNKSELLYTALGFFMFAAAPALRPFGNALYPLGALLMVYTLWLLLRREEGSRHAMQLKLDKEGRITKDRGLEYVLGWRSDDAAGEPFGAFVYPEDLPLWEKAVEKMLESCEPATLELRAMHARGRLTWLRGYLDCRDGGLGFEAFEVTPYKLVEGTLRRQQRLLKGVSDATRTMLAAGSDLSWPLNKAIASLAMSLGAERAYLYRMGSHDQSGKRRAQMQVEWVRDVLKTRLDSPLSGELLENDPRFTRWFSELEHGQIIAGPVARLPGEERLMLEANDVGSILLLPLLIGGDFWGFAGFELPESNRVFSREMLSVLRTAAAALAAGIERVESGKELRLQRFILDRIQEAGGDGILALDPQGRPLFYNRRLEEIWSLESGELSDTATTNLSFFTRHAKDPEAFAEVLLELHEHPQRHIRLELPLKDGRVIEAISTPLTANGATGGRVWFMRDVSAERRLQEALAHSEKRFRAIVDNASDITCILDKERRVHYISPAVEEVLGYEVRALPGKAIDNFVHPEDREKLTSVINEALQNPDKEIYLTVRMKSAGGMLRWLEVRGSNLIANPAIKGLLLRARDITEQKVCEAQIAQMVFFDPLTGLANRRMLRERVEEALRDGKEAFALICLDLNRFKKINDTLGHDVGDALLVQVAERLKKLTGENELLARLGGDEFGFVVMRPNQEDVLEMAKLLVHELQRPPFVIDDRYIHVSGSAGVAFYPEDGETFETLLRHADIAMHHAKDDNEALRPYSPLLNVYSKERFQLEADLRTALKSGNMTLYYQPIQVAASGAIIGLEALVRWEHPARGQIFPEEFLSVVEEAGLSAEFDRQILSQAVRQLAAWRGNATPWVSVNVGHALLSDPQLVDFLRKLLQQEEVAANRLLIEVTETQASRDPQRTKAVLQKLKDLGVRVALDDFGQGYSSLSYISDFPIDMIKIDRAFVAGVPFLPKDAGIVRMVIALAVQMGVEVLAEGVETEIQRTWLREAGVNLLQGYAISEALPPAELSFGNAS